MAAVQKGRGQAGSIFYMAPSKVKAGKEKLKKRAAVELGLDFTPSKQKHIKGNNKRKGLVGNDNTEQSTISRYVTIWNGLMKFCFLTGDYDSGIICHRDDCPSNPPPVDLDTAIHFLRFRCFEKGVPLLNHRTEQPILDTDGRPISCCGDWNSKNTVKLYGQALTKLHTAYPDHNCAYVEECPECKQLYTSSNSGSIGCIDHAGKPLLKKKGNPVLDKDFKTNKSNMDTYVDQHYESRSTIALMPTEVRDIRDALLLRNDLFGLMVWTMIIVAIKLFLRVEEATGLRMENFNDNMKYFAIKKEGVEALAMWIFGKSDDFAVNLLLWDDLECPEFSATRALMIWIAVSGIKSGYLFPTKGELGNLAPNGECKTHFAYEDFLSEIKHLVLNVCGRPAVNSKGIATLIGTHILRKTAYFFGYLGYQREYKRCELTQLDQANILLSARHKSIGSAAGYLQDAGAIKVLLDSDELDRNDPRMKVSVWKPIYIHPEKSNWETVNLRSRRFIKPLAELSRDFVFGKLGVPDEKGFLGMTIRKIHELACKLKPSVSAEKELNELLLSRLSHDEYKVAKARMDEMIQASVQHAVEHALERFSGLNIGGAAAVSPTSVAVGGPSPSTQKKPAKETFEPSKDFQKIASKLTRNKVGLLDICFEACEETKVAVSQGKQLTTTFKGWVYKAGKVWRCCKECYAGDKESFLMENPNFVLSTFKCGKLSGENKHSTIFS
jgi:hypothetical protein